MYFYSRYCAFYAGQKENEVFVTTKRAARNMSYQEMTAENGKIKFVDGAEKVFHLTLFHTVHCYNIPKNVYLYIDYFYLILFRYQAKSYLVWH